MPAPWMVSCIYSAHISQRPLKAYTIKLSIFPESSFYNHFSNLSPYCPMNAVEIYYRSSALNSAAVLIKVYSSVPIPFIALCNNSAAFCIFEPSANILWKFLTIIRYIIVVQRILLNYTKKNFMCKIKKLLTLFEKSYC